MRWILTAIFIVTPLSAVAQSKGNRLAYLDELDPYYPNKDFPKLITPQWVGEPGVDAVVILGIDDMRDTKRYETYLRPILNRLKKIDGRAAMSIMTCKVDPKDPQLQTWLKEGVSIETHTYDHPCPIFKKGFKFAKETYDKAVDMMFEIPNNKPVAFRMPCCDSLNTPSPRFWAEIFNKVTPKRGRESFSPNQKDGKKPMGGAKKTPDPVGGNFLSIDTSVFNVFTSADKVLPRELVLENGRERFRKYQPKDRHFVNYIENYPYPYVIGRLCWEFPCVTPSDWSAQHYHGKNNAITLKDWQRALDCTVVKKGVFCLVFHPHGWIRNDQIVQLIDYAQEKYGKRVKFLNFREALERLERNLTHKQPFGRRRNDEFSHPDNGIRLVDLDNDSFLDIIVGLPEKRTTRIWNSRELKWTDLEFPSLLATDVNLFRTMLRIPSRWAVLESKGLPSIIWTTFGYGVHYRDKNWIAEPKVWRGLKGVFRKEIGGVGRDEKTDIYFRDVDEDGVTELLFFAAPRSNLAFKWFPGAGWKKLAFAPPEITTFATDHNEIRFLDLNNDNKLDIIFSNEKSYGVYLFTDMKRGWSKKIIAGKQGDKNAIPPIVRNGTNNGFFVHGRSLYWANEDTALLKDHVRRITFDELLNTNRGEHREPQRKKKESNHDKPCNCGNPDAISLCAPLRPLRLNPPAPTANAGGSPMPKPKSPTDSLKTIQTRPGFTVELVAAEPLVKDPIAINWGINDGKLWVVEMGDYPNGINGNPGGRVKFLTDANKDGKYDKATIFLDKLPFPTGVTPWKKGVLITAAPDIIYAEDTNGDGKADIRKVLYTGFGEGNQQHRVNGLWWGLDGWFYGANGDSGGVVKSIKTGKSVNISGRDFRIKPDEGLIEPVTGQTQFGRCRDDWGNWFGCNNSFPLFHFVLPDHYLRRNPHVKYPPAKINIIPRNDVIYPISKPLPRFNDFNTLNRFTSACSAMIYRDDFFGPEFYGNAFIAEPVHNLISRRILTPKGITFTAKRAKGEEKSEFLASSDNWFRPTMVRMGPDGALWIADMYRLVIEHPQWIPKDWQAKLDLRSGHDRGRIYRVVPVGKKETLRTLPASLSDHYGLLKSRNGWIRDNAHLLLDPVFTNNDAIPTKVFAMIAGDLFDEASHQAKACILQLFNQYWTESDKYYEKFFRLSNPNVRRSAVLASETLAQKKTRLADFFAKITNDASPMVRIQLAFTLGYWKDKRAAQTLAQMALREHENPYIFAAILSSISKDNIDAVSQEVMRVAKNAPPPKVVQELLRLNQALGKGKSQARLLQLLTAKQQGGPTLGQMAVVAEWLDSNSDKQLKNILLNSELELKAAARQLRYFVRSARDVLGDGKSSPGAKRQAIRLLGRGILKVDDEIAVLAGFLKATVGPVLQEAAIDSLARSANPQAVKTMFAAWKQLSPARRSHVVGIVLQNPHGNDWLLDQLAKKTVAPSEIDAVYRQRLLNHSLDRIKNRAKKLFQISDNEDRQKLLSRYEPALKATGDPKIGLKIFEKNCAACHRLHNIGTEVGPDLAALTDKSKPTLLTAILDPNKAVEAKFLGYAVATTAGRLLSGLIAEETGTSITLVEANGKKHVLLRKDIAQLGGTGKSAMPEGLERDISVEAMPHLLAFIRKGT